MTSHKQLLADQLVLVQEAGSQLSRLEANTWNAIQADLNLESIAQNPTQLTSRRQYYRHVYTHR